MVHVRIHKHDQIHCKNELLARALVCRKSIYLGDMVLKYDGVLRAFKLKKEHVPTNLYGHVAVISNGTCEDYYKAAQRTGRFHHIQEIFSSDTLYTDFDEVELGASSWQPKLDALQSQIDDLDSTYATDAEVVASFATQIAAAGDVFTLVTNKVAVETTRATLAEQQIQADVDQNEADGDADRAAIRAEFAAVDSTISQAVTDEAAAARLAESQIQADVDQNEADGDADRALIRQQYIAADDVVNQSVIDEAAAARLAESQIQADVDQNEADGDADRALIRQQYIAADDVVSQAVVDEAAAARAAEGANTAAIGVERSRIDTIISLPNAALNNFAAIQSAYEAADQSADSALTALVTSKVASSDLDTLVTQVDAVEANTLKRDNAAQDQRYYQKGDVDSAVGLRVLQTAFDTAIGDRQTTSAADLKYRLLSDSLSKTAAEAADNARVLQTAFDTAIGDRQTTSAADLKYRLLSDSLSKTAAEAADNARVLQTAFDTAIGDRQTTSVADGKYYLKTDTYDKNEIDTRDGLRVLQTAYDTAIAARQTTVDQEATYRKKANSHHKDDVYTKVAADAEFHTQAYVAGQLALKQPVVGDDHLQISHTTGLTAALAAKQPTVGDDDLAISHTVGLTAALAAKQPTVGDDDLAISHTVGLTAALAAKQPTVGDDDLAISHTVGLTAALAARLSNTGAQSVTHNSSSAVLTLNNANADQMHLNCIGADGHIRLIGGNVLECTRDGGMTIRCNNTNSSVNLQSRGSNKVVCDDKVRLKTATVCESDLTVEGSFVSTKAAPATAISAGTEGEIRVDADYIYVCTGTNVWKRTSAGAAW